MPISVEPTGPISLPYPSLATLLAWSTTYQGLVGAGDAAGAIDTIRYPYEDLLNAPVPAPFAVITNGDDLHWEMERATFDQTGALSIEFFMLPNTPPYGGIYTDPRDVMLDFCNKLGAVLTEMLTNARNAIPDDSGNFFFNLIRCRQNRAPQLLKSQDTDTLQTVDGSAVTELLFAGYICEWN
jgi:hypothetical protein